MNTASITLKCDPKTGEVLNKHEIQMPKIDPRLIPPLEMKLLCQTLCEVMDRFYSDLENCRRYVEWMKSQGKEVDEARVYKRAELLRNTNRSTQNHKYDRQQNKK